MLLSLKFGPSDFAALLKDDRAYSDHGLSWRFRTDLEKAILDQLEEQLEENLVGARIIMKPPLGPPSGPGRRFEPIIVRDVIRAGGLQVPQIDIRLDTALGFKVKEFTLEPPLKPGYPGYRSWVSALPEIRLGKEMATRERQFVKVNGFFLPLILTSFRKKDVKQCNCPLHLLTPDSTFRNRCFYVTWICNLCGKKYACACSHGVIEAVSAEGWMFAIPEIMSDKRMGFGKASGAEKDVLMKVFAQAGPIERQAKQDLKEISYRNEICHLCREIQPTRTFKQDADIVFDRFRPYFWSEAIRSGVSCRDAENRVRERLRMPRIGEGWVSETQLYYTVRALFQDYEIVREASPDWLGRMRFDIYMPAVKIAIEYQGEQHYDPVGRFGGEEGLERTQERDRLKRELASEAGVEVIEFRYDEDLTDMEIFQRISHAIRDKKTGLGPGEKR